MSQLPEALRLAALLESGSIWEDQEQAAAELRRLHEVEFRYHELLFAVNATETRHDPALRYIRRAKDNIARGRCAAIAKAEGKDEKA